MKGGKKFKRKSEEKESKCKNLIAPQFQSDI